MTSTSPEPTVVRNLPASSVVGAALDKSLRSGQWTRLGSDSVAGDEVTERVLSTLAAHAHDAARAQGYAVGWAEGSRAAEAKVREQAAELAALEERARLDRQEMHLVALSALNTAVASATSQLAETFTAIESESVALAIRIAEAIVGREVATAADPGAEAIARALALLPDDATVTVRLHPTDRAALGELPTERQHVTLVADPSLQRGDAVAETATQVVDATLEAAIERVRRVLLP